MKQKDWKKVTNTIVQWLRERVKDASAKGLVVGLSGGVDSSVTSILCKKAFPENTLGLIMPCFSNPSDIEHAILLADTFDINIKKIELTPVLETFYTQLSGETYSETYQSLAIANIKPRLRMITLYYFANKNNYLVCGTGNKSELCVGYFTKYGDGGVDLLPIGDLLKTEVRELAKYLGVPKVIIEKTPSAGLWTGQTDEHELGITYDVLDRYLQIGEGSAEVKDTVERMIANSAHKRNTPPVCKVSEFGI
ncbi:MAG: NAD(+) synthase [Methanosarcinales archaeon]